MHGARQSDLLTVMGCLLGISCAFHICYTSYTDVSMGCRTLRLQSGSTAVIWRHGQRSSGSGRCRCWCMACDIGNPAKSLHSSLLWSERILAENFAQVGAAPAHMSFIMCVHRLMHVRTVAALQF